jgi:hypothetical protein
MKPSLRFVSSFEQQIIDLLLNLIVGYLGSKILDFAIKRSWSRLRQFASRINAVFPAKPIATSNEDFGVWMNKRLREEGLDKFDDVDMRSGRLSHPIALNAKEHLSFERLLQEWDAMSDARLSGLLQFPSNATT